jgi:hypothetical protein
MAYKLPADVIDKELVLEFFWRFSAFECALKREGFLRASSGWAEPNWKAFSRDIQGQFSGVATPEFHQAVAELKRLAPRRQIVVDGRLAWETVVQGDKSDEAFTIDLLKTVRNNLFHGGKYPDGPVGEIARDRNILRAALAILDGCYELHAGLRRWMDEAA